MVTPGGRPMSVAMTNCGEFGWLTDRTGYRYDITDPDTGVPWPAMPAVFPDLASRAQSVRYAASHMRRTIVASRCEPPS
jgi:alkylated DNA repair protein (DNA oxidative demethylase)